MSTAKTGRNDPCPCGSGRKYKRCCLEQDEAHGRTDPTAEIRQQLETALGEREFESLEEAQAFIGAFMAGQKQEPLADFDGLTPEAMHALLYYTFDAPGVVHFAEHLDVEPEAPILTLFSLLAEAIGDKGLKPTAKGNLPRYFCREAAQAYWGEATYREKTRYAGINQERDFMDLHVLRVVAELAGLLRKYRGRLILSRLARTTLAGQGMAGIYPMLFETYATEFNWAYRDRHAELRIVQMSFAFTLYLLHRHGDRERSCVFYEDAFLRAFPQAFEEVVDLNFYPAERQLRHCYRNRALGNFCRLFGLVVMERVGQDIVPDDYRVTATPLLHRLVKFPVSAALDHA